MKKILILGHQGMLGQMATRYFQSRGMEVATIAERFTFTADCPALRKLPEVGPAIVINCIGRIKQKAATRQDLFEVNSVLPLQLYERLSDQQYLIQPSTDCVFAGNVVRPYASDDPCDAQDDYGWSKRLGEIGLIGKSRAAIVRVSIIGPDFLDPTPRGLLGWFLNQPKGARLQGFGNHFWNGITTLEWCRTVDRLFVTPFNASKFGRLIQLGTERVYSKFEMLNLFQKEYNTYFHIEMVHTDHSVYRALLPEIMSPPLDEQLADLRNFIP